MNNYYEILEVSKNASKEVIEKAYKVLAKKYHPDLQEESQKKIAEEKMKLINEAYEILSDDERRKNYDIQLEKIGQKYNNVNKQNEEIINNEEDFYEEEHILTREEIKEQRKQEKRAQMEYQEEQDRIYKNYMRSLGYKVKEKWTLKKIIRLLKALGILFIAILIIWFFPPTHKLIIETYEENQVVKVMVNTFINIVKGFGNGITNFFKSIFS